MLRRLMVPAALLVLLVPGSAFAECDPGGRCCDDEECCSDGLDNDEDGLVDCEEASCAGIAGCGSGGAEVICDDGEDNDADGAADCDDEDCADTDACAGETDCANDVDDDADGLIDCADTADCSSSPDCVEAQCENGVDDDGDGAADCADADCAGTGCCPGPERCDDLIDNNLDGLIDCEDEDRCIDADVCAPPGEICDDEEDNDGDGLADCEDPQCVRFAACPPPAEPPPPPTLFANEGSLGCLWSPNHHVVCLDGSAFEFEAEGGCGALHLEFVSCSSSQPDDALGDGNTEGDCVVDGSHVCIRAERQGTEKADRTYEIVAVAVDVLGRPSEPVTIGFVRVPHDGRSASRCAEPLR